jgi:5-formyltetrahydrofolate cyclo-ligase
MFAQLLSSEEYQASRRVSVYLSMKHEVRTDGILEDIFASGRMCFVPYYEPNSTHMEMLRAQSMEDIANMPKTKWKISQPRGRSWTPLSARGVASDTKQMAM